jgi:hypothetical protein
MFFLPSLSFPLILSACSFGWSLVAGADLF